MSKCEQVLSSKLQRDTTITACLKHFYQSDYKNFLSVNIYFKLFISLLIVSRYLYTQFSDDKTLYEQPLWTVRLFTEKILTEKNIF